MLTSFTPLERISVPGSTTIPTVNLQKYVSEADPANLPKLTKDLNAYLKKKGVKVVITKCEVAAGGKAVKLTVNADDPTPVKNALK
jgi:hypothetical protein